MKARLAVLLAVFLAVSGAHAAVTVDEQILQKGLFVKSGCTPGEGKEADKDFNNCACEADIRYPVLHGMLDPQTQSVLNDSFRHDAEAAKCEGESKPAAAKAEGESASHSYHYEITFQSPVLLGFEFTNWGYSGGAHGGGTVKGVILDLGKGKIVSLGDLIVAADIGPVNKAIYDTLVVRPTGEAFSGIIESRKGKFIAEGKCNDCTLILGKDGVKVVFQAYAVASGAEGNVEVPLPAKYISYPAVAQALTTQQKSQVEKK